MKIAIMGTGGLGGYIGGRLAQDGQDVTFIARGVQLEAIEQNGLQGKSIQGEFHIQPAQATNNPAEVGPVDLILFCVKSYDTVSAAEAMRPMVGPETVVIPVLNGIQHIEQLSEILGADHVLGGMTIMTAHVIAPGVVERIGDHGVLEFGEMQGGLSDRCQKIQQTLGIDGIQGTLMPNIAERMWWKFAGFCGVGIVAVIRGNKEIVWRSPEAVDMIYEAMAEAVAVGQAKGVAIDSSIIDEAKNLLEGAPPHWKPSLAVSLERGQRIEVEAINGTLSRMGKDVGVPTPVNDFIYACLKPYADGQQ